MKELIAIVMAAVLVNNYVLAQFLGICPFLGVSKKLDQAAGMSVASSITKMTATLIPAAWSSFLDTPRKGQMPKNWAST